MKAQRKFVRFYDSDSGKTSYGLVEGEQVIPLSLPPWQGIEEESGRRTLSEVKWLAPVQPSKIICVGLNYHAHVKASQSADEAPEYPLLFLKPSSAIVGPGDKIVHPPQSERVDYEAELGVVIGKETRNVSREEAEQYIFGFTCVNDVTARDLQKKDRQWTRAKGFDTFCPVGPWIVDELDYRDVLIEGIQNGEAVQSGRTSLMIFDIPYLISFISSIMTLNPGDLISTGTPAKIAPMKTGDMVAVRIEGIGTLENVMA